MRVLVAPDSFKGTLDAAGVARAVKRGWLSVRPEDEVRMLPLADGGEGSLEVLHTAVEGSRLETVPSVHGPDSRPVDAAWLACPDGTAVVELARSSGLPLMGKLDPLGAHTLGLGEVLRAAARDPRTRRLVVALGGSASTDGGTGALRALGARFLDATGARLPLGGGALVDLAQVDLSELVPMPAVTCLVDVAAPLLGPTGAAAVFGPQKGASPHEVERLDAGLARLAEVLGAAGLASSPGTGAAGGTSFGLAAALGAQVALGSVHLAHLAGLDAALEAAELVITGEGAFDAQSLTGKIVGEVLARAQSHGVRALVIAGRVPEPGLVPGVATVSLEDTARSEIAALAEPERWAAAAAARLAREHSDAAR